MRELTFGNDRMKSMYNWVGALAFVLVSAPGEGRAALALDDASQGAYSDGWSTGDNGGSGFGAWTLNNSGSGGWFVGSSANNGFANGNIDVNGKSWGLWANSGGLSEATRQFPSALSAGQTFYLKMDNGFVQNGGTVGFALRNGSNNRFEFLFIGGNANYLVNDSTTGRNTGVGFTSAGLSLAFTLTGTDSYSLAINGGTPMTGTLAGSGSIDTLRFFNANAGTGSAYDLFFNSLEVVPEPTNIALMIFAGGALVLAGVRRWRAPALATTPVNR
jgi:hypothetical protein